ncbi:thiamine ABC transporter substrate-binding protein [Rhodoferax saidenbachensis]|uniref:Thiamine ABC transporter substrate-binding protein n=1 Tax=Rhodoferax saidenbachensis TaxID=1484693 RepID=A0A1P8KBU3_9BURK|nr:thiamine ABC transporter substrate-binding protein [Rhodoferax saidenbachensis]APW43490.1 thiamine ABC transporter substrate-binding protein [Rhodoferax saidenbachensis]
MKRGIFSFLGITCAVALVTVGLGTSVHAAELRVLTHSSFTVPKPLLKQFETNTGITLRITKGGDAGEMLNKLILTKAEPIADVVYGIDNALAPKALAAGVLDAYAGSATSRETSAPLPAGLVPVDYGYVTVNFDKAWFAKSGLALPKTLDELAQPAYAKLLVVQNPATSSPGNAFLLATIGALGEEKAFDWWARMRTNGVKVAKGWSEAYYTEFSRNGGKYPLVVSYSASPAAELFYAKDKPTEPPTGSLSIPGAVFRQVEGVALVKGGKEREAAGKFIEFLRSAAVQTQMQTEMWMYPVEAGVARVDVMKFAPEPTVFHSPGERDIATKGAAWVSRWTKVVLK